jgi:hypothetical protein
MREMKEDILAKQEEEVNSRLNEFKAEVVGRLSSFLRLYDSRDRLSAEEGMRVRGMYEELKEGGEGVIERLAEFDGTSPTLWIG